MGQALRDRDDQGGFVDDGTFNSMGDIDGDAGEGLGALLTVAPIDGLTVGLGIYPKAATRIETNSKDWPLGRGILPIRTPLTPLSTPSSLTAPPMR
jgi:hypothetical protein